MMIRSQCFLGAVNPSHIRSINNVCSDGQIRAFLFISLVEVELGFAFWWWGTCGERLLLAEVLQTCRGVSQRDRRGVRNGLGNTAHPRSIGHVEPRPWVITERVPRMPFRSPRAETARRDRAQSRSAPRLHNESRVLLPKIARPRRRRGEQVDHKAAGLGVALCPRVGRSV